MGLSILVRAHLWLRYYPNKARGKLDPDQISRQSRARRLTLHYFIQ